MIKIKNVNKYFNKNKNNEIHVINGTTLSFPETGLVCLLGASGSGKTTLLNVVGGLDKINSGEIEFKDYIMKKYKASKWDYIRNRHFGYIFQNYILLPELTVYQNLEFVLKMLSIDKEEMEKRIDYALDAVGMIKYKKRKPTQLSGGQQQRIAIARALIKSPDVVIADEPTGNLDEKNTQQIMNIIKKISKECLVILVTHERRLAEFYGDRIIEIKDGRVINDEATLNNGELYETENNNIYLKEYNYEVASSEDLNIKYFYKEDKEKLDLDIIFKDNTFYIQSKQTNLKIKFIDKSDEIKIIDSKKPVVTKQTVDDFEYHLPKIEYKETKNQTVLKFTDTIKMALNHLGGLRKRQKLLFLVMFFSTIMITIGFINLFSSRHVEEADFMNFNRNLITILDPDVDFRSAHNDLGDGAIFLGNPDSLSVNVFNNGYFNHKRNGIGTWNPSNYTSKNSIVPIDLIENVKIVEGRMPENSSEALIDKYLVDKYITYSEFISSGIKYSEQFIGLEFSVNNYFGNTSNEFKIVGIVDNNNPNIYINFNTYKNKLVESNVIFRLDNYYPFKNFNEISETNYKKINEDGSISNETYLISELDLGLHEVLIDHEIYLQHQDLNELNIGFDNNLKVVGVIQTTKSLNNFYIYLSEETTDSLYNEYIYDQIYSPYIYSPSPKATLEKLTSKNIQAESLYDSAYNQLLESTMNRDLFIFSLGILAASLIFLYFLMRSSLISRIYQIGVYRALGVKKFNVYKIFLMEILIITLITSSIALLLVSFFINQANSLIDLIYYPWFIAPLTLLFMLVVNVIVGLIPVNNLLRLTPSQILSKYDI